MRHLAWLFVLAACGALTGEEQDLLVSYQRNAGLYYEGGRLNQAMGQVERGLELAPDDYKLNALKGSILLRASASASGTDHRQLDAASELLARIFAERAPDRHEPYLLTSYALALQKQGLRSLGEAVRLEGQASRSAAEQATPLREQAASQRQTATSQLSQAYDLLGILIERGEVLRLAHNHRLQIARQLGNDDAFTSEAAAYLKQCEVDKSWLESEIERTQHAAYETERLQQRRQLLDEELEVRTLLADFYYSKRNFQDALAQLDRVLQLDPQRSVDYYNRGRVLLELQREEAAKTDFRKFLATTTLPASSEKSVFALRAIDR